MRGEYDAILEWPFHFKVKFSLITKDDQEHFVNFFWPDTRSNCFQRPRLEMNEAYGIERFISLDEFKRNENQYVQDDTMFIKVQVDFLSKSLGKKSYWKENSLFLSI
jgi:TNF receptor-associated factor 2/TNF receptor-associated factor 3